MLLSALLAVALPQEPKPAPAQPQAPARIDVDLQPVVPAHGEHLSWSPKGARVELKADGDALAGSFPLGPQGAAPVRVRLGKSKGAAHFDTLSIDLDRDGAFGANETLTTTPKEQRGKWWSSFEAEAKVPFPAADGHPAATVPYAMSLWFVADPQEADAPPLLRWTRRGWFEGKVVLGGHPVFVLVSELELDGVITTADSWALATELKVLLASSSRELGKHCWVEDKAWRAVHVDPSGLHLQLEAFAPGTTEAEENAKADVYKIDRESRRAEKPLAFDTGFAKAQAAAKADKKRLFVDFATTWCGPCKLMDQWVYTAADVVGAAKDVVCVKLDGDAERELVKRFGVNGYPTMLLFDADGNELRRAVGYQGVAAMVKFLAK